MSQPIRAVYQQGHIRLLEPVDLVEGQEIQLVILSDREQVISALGDLVSPVELFTAEVTDAEALLQEVSEAFRGLPSVSDSIIAERREGR
jgi:predicted DNA-binding antitoxin AbrB/MazE fold protein